MKIFNLIIQVIIVISFICLFASFIIYGSLMTNMNLQTFKFLFNVSVISFIVGFVSCFLRLLIESVYKTKSERFN